MKIEEIFELAFQNQKKKNFRIAEKLYKEILEKQPNHFQSIFYLGTLSIQTGKFQISKTYYEKAVREEPKIIEEDIDG